MKARKDKKAEKSPLKLLIWTAVAGLIFGLIGFGELAEDWLRVARNRLHQHPASGEIVLVSIDEKSLREVGRWPWARSNHARVVDSLAAAGAKRIFLDIAFYGPTNPEDDSRLADSFRRADRVVLPVKALSGADRIGVERDSAPPPAFARHTQIGAISVRYNYQNAAWRIPYALEVDGQTVSSFAAQLAGVSGPAGELFIPDYSIDPKSIPAISAADLLAGNFDPGFFAGRDVVVGATADAAGDQYFIPGSGKMGGVYIQLIGAETLKGGKPVHYGWVPSFLLALGAAALALLRPGSRLSAPLVAGTAVLLLLMPAPLEAHLIFTDITPGLFVLAIVGTSLAWGRIRQRGFVNPMSGLPNLTALRLDKSGREKALIAARILNYNEISAALPAESEKQLIEQIVGRLSVGAPDRILYEGDDGIFAWFEETRVPFGNHLEALHSLFRNPARVGEQQIDLSISFGVEIGSSRSLSNRLGSALVAADEAAHAGLKWKYHDPDTLQDSRWKLSMLSQLDEAVDKGEIWIAYQPKLDLETRRIVGAEALARWTHPEKGPIAASEFIAAAEQHDRIGKLTDFILEKAVEAAAKLNRREGHFGIAVNLSARLLTDKGFLLRLSAMLARHRLPADRLTLELTETATLADSGAGIEMLAALRDLGVTIAIDDYGTGLSTLDYLKRIPASEIKIDQSFVRAMIENRSDRVMVQSTIALVHSLGRRVVAEGVETREVLDALTEMRCDLAQGFIIGRPMSFEALTKRLMADRKRRSA